MRSERFDLPFAVLLLTPLDEDVKAPRWSSAVEAVAEVKRDIDMLGWLTTGSALGLILVDADAAWQAEVQVRLHKALAARCGNGAAQNFLVNVCSGVASQCEAVESLVADIRQADPRAGIRGIVKRALDVVVSAVLLLLLAPLLAVVSVLVKLTSVGPVLFRQERIGAGARPFTIFKFRTMKAGADVEIHKAFVSRFIQARATPTGAEAPFKMVNDPRLTPLGKVLRKTSLDELPQLWNVLRGDMSLVGPRPPLAYEVEQYKPWHRRRILEAKPGITGLWQVAGRSQTSFDDMVRLDLRYARNVSLVTDLKLLIATVGAVNTGKGAC